MAFEPSLDAAGEHFLPTAVVPFPRGFAFSHDGRLILASGTRPNGVGDNALVAFDPSERKQSIRLVSDSELSPSIFRSLPTATSSCRASTHSDHQMPTRLFANTIPRTDISCASFSANRSAKISQTVWPAVWSRRQTLLRRTGRGCRFRFYKWRMFRKHSAISSAVRPNHRVFSLAKSQQQSGQMSPLIPHRNNR
jgi:hypothetical protein